MDKKGGVWKDGRVLCQICKHRCLPEQAEELHDYEGKMTEYRKYVCHKCQDEQTAINKQLEADNASREPEGKVND